jgi:hypothetical protein
MRTTHPDRRRVVERGSPPAHTQSADSAYEYGCGSGQGSVSSKGRFCTGTLLGDRAPRAILVCTGPRNA